MENKKSFLDRASFLTLVLTIVLFGVALFEKGFSQELLLEAGVFLVSAKLVIGNYQLKSTLENLENKIDALTKKSH